MLRSLTSWTLGRLPLWMKNANIFIDVDLTLVDAQGRLLDGARDALQRFREEGCHLFLWSSVGVDYARKIAKLHGLSEMFEGYASKPDIIIDDMPSTVHAPFAYNVQEEASWLTMAERIIQRHVDGAAERRPKRSKSPTRPIEDNPDQPLDLPRPS